MRPPWAAPRLHAVNSAALPLMSPQLSRRCALAVLVSMLVATVVGLLAWGPIGLEGRERRLTDPRLILGMLNGWTILLQVPLALATVAGALGARQAGPLSRAWQLFFWLTTLAVLSSAIDHLAPSTTGYVLSKLPTASACAVLSLLFLAERLGRAWVARPLLWAACAAGPLGGLLCLAAQAWAGQPDMRLLVWCEYLPMLLIPLGVWSLRSRGLEGSDWLVGLLWFAAAKLLDWADLAIWTASGGVIAGHALHHLPLAVCLGWLAWRVARQSPRAPEVAPSPSASRRATSLTTSG